MKYIPKLQNGKTIVQQSDVTRTTPRLLYKKPIQKLNTPQDFAKLAEQRGTTVTDSLIDLGGKPTEKKGNYWDFWGGRLETNLNQLGNLGMGVAKTVGASAALATGMAYIPATIGTLGTLGKGLLSGAVVDQGYSLLGGRPANIEEIGFGAGATMGMPLVGKGMIKGGKILGEHLLEKSRPYLSGDKRIPLMSYKPKMNFIENGIENGIDVKTFGINRVFEGKPLLISSNENAFKTTVGKFYRLTGQSQIDDIINNGGYVLAKRGKIKGGRFGETHWSKADGHTYNPNEGGYLIEADNIVHNQIGGIPSNSVNIYKVNNGKWELYKPTNPNIYKSITPAIGKNSELVRPITPTFWEDMHNATKQGIIESREVISNPVVQNTIRKNIETYKRLKPQAVVNENLGEIMQDLSKRKIHPKFTELDDITSGQLVDRGGETVDGYFNTQPWNALKPLQHHEATGFHEGLHIGRFGSYPIARDKVNRLYKPNSEWINKDNASYILDNISGEGVVNTYEMGKRAGLKIGQSYPGIDKFKEMLQNTNFGEKTEFANMLKLDTPRDYKRVWDAMTGKYFVAPIALTTGYKITQNKKE